MTLQHYAIAVTIGLFFIGTLFALVKYIVWQQDQREKERHAALTDQIGKLATELRQEAEATLNLERRFMEFKAELPRDYVRRDDFIRAIGTVQATVDNMALRMERAILSTRSSTGATQ